jgi:tellurite resistance protein TehA-like permease
MNEKEIYEEERKLTILLAKLNAEIQVELAEAFGLAALSVASYVAGNQFFTQNHPIPSLAFCLLIFGAVSMLLAVVIIRRLKRTMDKLRNLK